MKKRLLALLAALSLLLTGCASLLEQEYFHVNPYNPIPTAEGDPSTLRAESYQELVNALLYLVTGGQETGRIRLYLDSDDVESQLEAACLEVVQEDPLGAYCVDYIKHSVQPVLTYSDADVQIFYRRTQEQVASISSVTGVTAIRSELGEALTSFSTELVLRIGYFNGEESLIQDLCRQAYYANPAAVPHLPDISVAIYPEAGRLRIVEITLTYHLEQEELLRRRNELEKTLVQTAAAFPPLDEEALYPEVAGHLTDVCVYASEGGNTAYHALVEGSANSEGLALAMAALCAQADLPCQVVEGTLNDTPHFWNLVHTEQGWLHLDLTADAEEVPLLQANPAMEAAGYLWDAEALSQSQAVPYG